MRKGPETKKYLYDHERNEKVKEFSAMISKDKSKITIYWDLVELTENGLRTIEDNINIHKIDFSCFLYNEGHVEFISTKKKLEIWRKVEL